MKPSPINHFVHGNRARSTTINLPKFSPEPTFLILVINTPPHGRKSTNQPLDMFSTHEKKIRGKGGKEKRRKGREQELIHRCSFPYGSRTPNLSSLRGLRGSENAGTPPQFPARPAQRGGQGVFSSIPCSSPRLPMPRTGPRPKRVERNWGPSKERPGLGPGRGLGWDDRRNIPPGPVTNTTPNLSPLANKCTTR